MSSAGLQCTIESPHDVHSIFRSALKLNKLPCFWSVQQLIRRWRWKRWRRQPQPLQHQRRWRPRSEAIKANKSRRRLELLNGLRLSCSSSSNVRDVWLHRTLNTWSWHRCVEHPREKRCCLVSLNINITHMSKPNVQLHSITGGDSTTEGDFTSRIWELFPPLARMWFLSFFSLGPWTEFIKKTI